MADIIEKATVEVQVNGEQAKNELQSLEKYATSLKDRIAEAYNAGDTKKMKELEKELKKTNAQLRTMRTNAVNIDEVMQNLSTAGPKELQKTLKGINKELESGRIKRGSQEWHEYQAKLKLVSAEIRKIKAEGVEAEGFLSRMNGKLSKWGGMIASVIAGLTGVTLAFSKMRKDSMNKEESQDNLKALTGLDDESIVWLTQQAEVLATTMDKSGLRVKQSSQEILDAYTLVGSAKPELLSDKEALNAVTVETMRLSTAAKMDLKEAVDAVTLSMNQYGASADKAAQYTNVMAAGSKFGSVAVQSITAAVIKAGVSASGADVSIEQLVGTIETLGEKGIKDEVAGTGLKTFFLRLQTGADDTNPKVVGLQTALKNLKKLSTQGILDRFGQEAYTVAQTLIAGADKVDYYTKAVTGTNVAVEQAAINSDNAAAKVAQMKNKLQEAGIELMNKLNPSVNMLGTYFTNLIKILPPLIDFLQKYGKTIVYATIVVLTYVAAKKLQHFWLTKVKMATGEYIAIQKLKQFWDKAVAASTWLYIAATSALTGKTNQAKLAMKAFFLIIKANPFAAIVTTIVAVAGAFYLLSRRTAEVTKAQKAANDIHLDASKSISEEMNRMNALKKILFDSKKSYGERRYALLEIQKIVPEYHASLTKEGELLNNNTTALDGYVKKLFVTAKQQAANTKLQEALNARSEWFASQDKKEAIRFKSIEWDVKDPVNSAKSEEEIAASAGVSPTAYRSWSAKKSQFDQEVKLYEDMMKGYTIELANIDQKYKKTEETKNLDDNGGNSSLDDAAIKKNIQALEAKFAQEKAKQTALYAIGKIDKQAFDDFIVDSEVNLLEKKMKLYSKESKEYSDLLQQKLQMQVKRNEECQKENIQSIEKQIQEEKRLLLESYLDQSISKEAFEQGIFDLDVKALKAKRDMYAKETKEFDDYQKQLDELTNQDRLKKQQSYEEKIKQFRQEYQKKTADELMEEEIRAWDYFHALGIMKEEDYQKAIKAIKKKYAIQKGQNVGYGYNDQKYIEEIKAIVWQAKLKTISEKDIGNPETDSLWDTMFGNDAKLHAGVIDNLKSMEEEGLISHKKYLIAKGFADNEYFSLLESKASFAYAQIGALMSSYSSYASACQDVETAKIEKKYEKEIAAAGNNSAKVAKLEDAKEKEIAKVKTKYNKKATNIQIAKAIAETAIGALRAYNSAWELGPILGPILGPVFAGMALVSGMLQVATIKKQAQAQEAGYYQGGFTGGGAWNEEKGSVHAGEFVANRYAVRNKQILPVLQLIDNAQKNNTIGSLTAADISRTLRVDNPVVYSSGDKADTQSSETVKELLYVVARSSEVINRLTDRLNEPFQTVNTVDGPDGMKQAFDKYNGIQKNKSRHD